MPRFRLTPAEGPRKDWSLKWDDDDFVLEDPDGQLVLREATPRAHHQVDFSMAFVDGSFAITTPRGTLFFKGNGPVVPATKKLVADALQLDPDYRAKMLGKARFGIVFGTGMFVVATSLFVG